MRPNRAQALRLLGVLSAVALLGAATPPPESIPLDVPSAHLYVREPSHLPQLTTDARLTRVARDYAREMLTQGYFGHFGPDGSTPASRLRGSGYAFHAMAENIAFAPDVKTAQSHLEASPGHRRNMLDSRVTRIGVGVIADSIYGNAYVQEFAGD